MKQAHRGFTIIELLVVITIITLLVSLILPAMGQARETAKIVSCSSMERQQVIGLRSYGTDNRQYVPPLVYLGFSATSVVYQEWTYETNSSSPQYPANQFNNGTGGITEIYNLGYLQDPKAFYCPADGTKLGQFAASSAWLPNTAQSPGPTFMGYWYAGGFNTMFPTFIDPWSSYLNGFNEANQTAYVNGGGWFMPFLLAKFDEQAMDPQNGSMRRPMGVLTMDIVNGNGDTYYGNATMPPFSHKRNGCCTGTNVSFEDGHVKWYNMYDANWSYSYQNMGTATNAWHGDVWLSAVGIVKGFR